MAGSSLRKNLSWTTAGMILYNFAIWLLSALVLRLLGAQMSGYYAVAMSIGNTLYAVALWGMRSFIVSDTAHQFSYEEYCGARLSAIGVGAVVLIIILLVSHYDSTQILILTLYSIFKFTEALIELMDCFLQQQKQMDINAKSMLLRSALFIVFFFLTLKFTGSLAAGLAVVSALSLAVFFGYNLRRIRRVMPLARPSFSVRMPSILRQCFPIMSFELLAALVVAIPRLSYAALGSREALGIYTSIYTLVVFLQLAVNVLIYTLAPYMADAYSRHQKKDFRKYLSLLFLASAGLGLAAEGLVYWLGEPVIGLLYGAAAAPYYGYLYWGIISGVTLTWTWILSQLFVILHHPYDQLICSLIATAACWLLSQTMIQAGDCNTMSFALIGTNLVFLAAAAVLLLKRRKEAVK